MSQTFEFYDQRAKAAEAEADVAVLDNVRERELRSARAWRGMADRQFQIDAERIKADEARAERRAAELEALAVPGQVEH
jgi:nicotinate-nucleotide pyrophosphorylase